jgi:hypothetical protein
MMLGCVEWGITFHPLTFHPLTFHIPPLNIPPLPALPTPLLAAPSLCPHSLHVTSPHPTPHQHYQDIFELARRYKIMNPEKMRGDYGKLMYLLQVAYTTYTMHYATHAPAAGCEQRADHRAARVLCGCSN